jgi:predicted small secreted protein
MADTINEQDLIARAKQSFKLDYEAIEQAYNEMVDDLKFANGEQWPDAIRIQRENDDRPCLRINKIPMFVDRVLGDMRQARPSIKIRPVDDDADPKTADVLTGLCRHIEQNSDAEIVYDSGAEAMVRCGFGAWRVTTDYVDNESFEQEIGLQRIKNQFGIVFDPAAKNWDRSDGRRCFVYEDMPRSVFKKRWPNADPCDWTDGQDDLSGWISEETVRVAEYFEKDTTKKTLYLIQTEDGEKQATTELPEDKHTVLKKRQISTDEISWYRISGRQILEGPIKLAGKYIPIIPCYGKETNILSQSYYSGVTRHAKDSMRLYNYYRSMDAETVALAPKAPWIMTSTMLGKYKTQWAQANKRNFAYLLFNPDPKFPGVLPQRNIPQMANQAIMQNIMVADQELHDTTGLQLASLGKKSNEQSGRAIEARAKEGDVGQFTYVDNMIRSIKYTAKVVLDLIPHIYNTPRVARILNEDDSVKSVKINEITTDDKGNDQYFDLTVGKYDVVVSVGPSYQTQRQESLAAMLDFAKILDPPQRSVVADQIVQTSDWHGSDKMAERLKRMVPPELIGDDEANEEQEPQQPTQEEVAQQAMAEKVQQMEMEKAEIELEKERAELEKTKAEAAKAEAEAAIAEAKAAAVANGRLPVTEAK